MAEGGAQGERWGRGGGGVLVWKKEKPLSLVEKFDHDNKQQAVESQGFEVTVRIPMGLKGAAGSWGGKSRGKLALEPIRRMLEVGEHQNPGEKRWLRSR